MPLYPTSGVRKPFLSGMRYQYLAVFLLILFGLAMIANTQVAADGTWYWYAVILHNGKRLYADMHLALQPLMVLETEAFLDLVGNSWLATHVPAFLSVIVYVLGLWAIARQSTLSDAHKAILTASGFLLAISFTAYRFDDYHVLGDSLKTYSLIALLMIHKSKPGKEGMYRILGFAALLGALVGLVLMTRLPDGAAMILGCAICLLLLAPSSKLLSLAIYALSTVLTVLIVLHFTGDTVREWANASIFQAVGSKGGTGSVLAYPMILPRDLVRWFRYPMVKIFIAYTLGIAAIWTFLLRPSASPQTRTRIIKQSLGIALILFALRDIYHRFLTLDAIACVSTLYMLVLLLLIGLIILRFAVWVVAPARIPSWSPLETLLIIPFGQVLASTMGSAGGHVGIYAPLGMMILLLPITSPIQIRWEPLRSMLYAAIVVTAIFAAGYKIKTPYQWHTYTARPMFVDRHWYHHSLYGPMIIDSQLLNFIEPVCKDIAASGNQKELLSLPYGFANYFCGIPPWDDYVTTFYDTSTKETIFGLMDKLQKAPPQWIFYQRELDNLRLHEETFNRGQPIPHRYLDQLIMQKIAQGEWQVVFTSDFNNREHMSNQWLLIRTRP